MKKTLKKLLTALSETGAASSFKVRLWDGETLRFGANEPAFVLILKTKNAAKRIFASGTLGFGEEYMAGNIDVEGDFKELMHLGTLPAF